ncbi:hypothetical protein PMAYCL1PPCAC_10924, partial [Pristionchus mayeri]
SFHFSNGVLNAHSHNIRKGRAKIRLREGEVGGRVEEAGGILGEVYDSIPYAELPDKELRFEMPRPIVRWNGTYNSSVLAHCLQYSMHDATHTTMDCLHVKYLGKALYNTSGILTGIGSRKIIFVAAAYRLGCLGFSPSSPPIFPATSRCTISPLLFASCTRMQKPLERILSESPSQGNRRAQL